MVRIVVVGGGFAGLSAAARLAKLRHEVVLLEASDQLGGRLRRIDVDGQPYALSPETITVPGVLRDLFRKSGRPLERSADLVPAGSRRHLFVTGEQIDLPFGNRADQHDAVMAALDEDEWSPWVDRWPDAWDTVRRAWLDQLPTGRADLDRAARKHLRTRESLGRHVAKHVKDPALAKIVLDPLRLDGQDRRLVPSMTAMRHYVERNFGLWTFDGGLPVLADAMTQRLTERKVDVRLTTAAQDISTVGDIRRSGTVTGVVTESGTIDADVVVWCAPRWPESVPTPKLNPAIPACRTFLQFAPTAPELPDDLFVHANPPIRLWHNGDARWTLIHQAGEDPLISLARAGIDLRDHLLTTPHTLSPADLVSTAHWGWQWSRFSALDQWPGFGTDGVHHRKDLFFAGAHAWPSGLLGGGTTEEIGMATAAIASHLGPAPRS